MKTEEMNRKQLAGMFDHTLLKADATPRDCVKKVTGMDSVW